MYVNKTENIHVRNVYDDKTKLKINESLPQIVLPNNKIAMLLDWYNKDLRLQHDIPIVFPKGYIFIDTQYTNIDINCEECKSFIKHTAKELKSSYRYVENQLNKLLLSLNNVVMFYKITEKNAESKYYYIDVYEKETGDRISTVSFETCNSDDANIRITDIVEDYTITKFSTWDEVLEKFNYYIVCLFASIFWYMATTTKTKKYHYINKMKHVEHNKKKVVNTKREKVIDTPIYDMKNVKIVDVDRLVKRREGYTYSHSFTVHGHYRHYKDGKVIFIESYEKGKGKEFRPQTIKLNPKN